MIKPSKWRLRETRDQVKRIFGKVSLWLGLAVCIYIFGLAIETLVDRGAAGPVTASHRLNLSTK
jgi:hypothetical protein